MRPKSLVSGLLIISHVFTGTPLSGQELSGSDAIGRAIILSIEEMHVPPVSQDGDLDWFTEGIAKELKQQSGFEVLRERNYRWARGIFDPIQGGRSILAPQIVRATEDYENLRPFEVQANLGRALQDLREGSCSVEDLFYLVPAHLLMAKAFLALEERNEAIQSLREVLKLAPETVLSEREYAPSFRALFQEARMEMKKGGTATVDLSIRVFPKGARLFLDGKAVGSVPRSLKKIMPGSHYLAILKDGFQPVCRRIDLLPGESGALQLRLEKEEAEGPLTLRVSSFNRQEEITRRAVLLGELVGADQVLLLQREKTLTGVITTYLVDVARRRLVAKKGLGVTTLRHADLSEIARDLSDAGSIVSMRPDHDAAAVPVPRREKKPLWKRPLFWIIGGLLIAGAGAGAGVAFGGGGGGSPTTSVSIDTPVPGGLRR